eukprot:5060280-Pyramimonas_sp.AAC.1
MDSDKVFIVLETIQKETSRKTLPMFSNEVLIATFAHAAPRDDHQDWMLLTAADVKSLLRQFHLDMGQSKQSRQTNANVPGAKTRA